MARAAKPPPTSPGASRRGRPRAGEREERRRRVLDAAFDELLEHGYELTMLGVASRASASKGTLYSWFGSRKGLFAALIAELADATAERVQTALDGDGDPRDTLIDFATGLLMLLTSEQSTALNRAAMSSPELAKVLLITGRHRVGPLVEAYLAHLSDQQYLDITDTDDAFRLLYGLVIEDTQIRVLLGEPPPPQKEIAARATAATDRFLQLTQTRAPSPPQHPPASRHQATA